MKNMKTIPFDYELAKEIHEGKREGRIVTRLGSPVEILKFDAELHNGDIVFITSFCDIHKIIRIVNNDGRETLCTTPSVYDLFLEVPEEAPAEEDEPKFKPFDRVLVRDSEDSIWNCELREAWR